MDFNSKTYQKVKLKEYFKKTGFFLVFHSAKLDLAKWLLTEQNLKKLKLNYYKPLNKIASKTLNSSIHRNLSSSIAGFVLFIRSQYRTTSFNLSSIIKSLKPSFTLVSIKLNNKFYSTAQLKGLDSLSYRKSAFNLYKVLDKQLKTSYLLTSKKKISK